MLVSRGGGNAPRWRGDGRELFYLAPDGKLMAVDVTTSARFQAGTPSPLFQTPPGTLAVDAAADGKRFLLVAPGGVERIGAVYGRAELDVRPEGIRT